ncbi:MAG TPA: TniQ family protein [Ktedonobacteraceae bacterium]|nr:TniQ family protein [Ktedonobacteraceae bacterium]
MRSITVSDPEWNETFPHPVSPLQDEWLPGFLLRCDEANGWLSGTTARLISTKLRSFDLYDPNKYIIAQHLQLDKLTQLLALPLEVLLATTFLPALKRLYNYVGVPPEWSLGQPKSIGVCPACMNESRLLGTSVVLPYLQHCPIHHLAFQRRCRCGAFLKLFSPELPPFSCWECGSDWSRLTRLPGDPTLLELEEHYFSLYTLFLTEGTWFYLTRTFDLIGEERKSIFRSPVLWRFRKDSYDLMPLDRLVKTLVELGFSAHELMLNIHPARRRNRSCLNHACPYFALEQAGNVILLDYYQAYLDAVKPVWFCQACGSCFMDNRLCLTFDKNCAGDDPEILYPREKTILGNREYLEYTKKSLRSLCRKMLAKGLKIDVQTVFAEEAGLISNPVLKLPRLGLAQIVQEFADKQQRATI